jgi:lysophospholipase L1-like esterase
MKKIKIILLMVLCMAIILGAAPIQFLQADAASKALPTYVALGDSITSGFGLVSFKDNDINNRTSPDNYVVRLGKRLGMNPVNLGIEGYDSTQLLKMITNPAQQQKADINKLKSASLVTISVGGNNVFIPLINAIDEKLGSNKNIFESDILDVSIAIASLIFDKSSYRKLQNTVAGSTLKFTGDSKQKKTGEFETIINTVNKLNPKAQIIVQTVYNPYKNLLPAEFSKAVDTINAAIISKSSGGKNYKVADVASAFDKAAKGTQLVNSDSGNSFDPHPTKKGHQVIYTLMAYAAQNKLPYSVKSSVSKGKASTKLYQGNLIVTITPDKGYKAPKSITLAIGKTYRKSLTVKNGSVSIPAADVSADITVSGTCMK